MLETYKVVSTATTTTTTLLNLNDSAKLSTPSVPYLFQAFAS